jgi:AcrR family transcriptional regulator
MDENIIVRLEQEKVVTATFRKLSPAKKDKIYKATLKLFGADAFESVLLENIAKTAKVSKGSLIQYFGLKENLFLFLGEIVVSNYISYFDNYFLNESLVRTKDRIEQFVLSHKIYRKNNGDEFGFILNMLFENSNKLSGSFVNRIFDIQKEYLKMIIERGVQSNQLRRDVRIQYLVSVFHSIFFGLLRERFLDKTISQKIDFSQNLNQSLNIVFDGIK